MTRDEAPLRGPFHDWYETWRAQQADRRETAERERRQHERDDRRIAKLLIVYACICGLCGALAVALVLTN